MTEAGGLAGMRVVDVSQQLPGPYASALLVDLGASVTKVEPPSGDPSRHLDPPMHTLVNAGKSSVTIDLKDPRGVEELHRLVESADVFIEGFRPGVAARLGAGWEVLSDLNPALVYCSISACGQDGPYAQVPMHDLNLQAMAGLDPGQGIGVPWVDLGTATSCALAIAAAWHRATLVGIGCHLDAAMVDTAVLWGRVKATSAARVEPTYGTFPTADGRRVAVAILEDHIWVRLCRALEWSDWQDDSDLVRYDQRVQRGAEVRDRLGAACVARTHKELLELAVTHDLPVTLVGVETGSGACAQLVQRQLLPAGGRRSPVPPGSDRVSTPPLDSSVD